MEEGIGRGNSVLDLHLRVIQQAQREIGRLWEQRSISIAQEHQATAVSQLALAHLYQQSIRRPAVGKHVLVACVEGELHDVGARICADVLDLYGFDVRFLGANVPTDCLLSFTEHTRPDLVALSVTLPTHLPPRALRSMRCTPGAGCRSPSVDVRSTCPGPARAGRG
jgi:methanogenic corrinoid protein MtbC1